MQIRMIQIRLQSNEKEILLSLEIIFVCCICLIPFHKRLYTSSLSSNREQVSHYCFFFSVLIKCAFSINMQKSKLIYWPKSHFLQKKKIRQFSQIINEIYNRCYALCNHLFFFALIALLLYLLIYRLKSIYITRTIYFKIIFMNIYKKKRWKFLNCLLLHHFSWYSSLFLRIAISTYLKNERFMVIKTSGHFNLTLQFYRIFIYH